MIFVSRSGTQRAEEPGDKGQRVGDAEPDPRREIDGPQREEQGHHHRTDGLPREPRGALYAACCAATRAKRNG